MFLTILKNWVEFGCSLKRFFYFVVKMGIFLARFVPLCVASIEMFLLELASFSQELGFFCKM